MQNQTNKTNEPCNSSDATQNDVPESPDNSPVKSHSFRRLMVFQLKLAVDALRDILLSPVSIICTIIDYFEKKHGADSNFEKLMVFGRNTERKINLFEQHGKEFSTIDSVVDRVEDVIVNEYQNKNISKKTLAAIQQALRKEKQE
jgi:hypothetical protein